MWSCDDDWLLSGVFFILQFFKSIINIVFFPPAEPDAKATHSVMAMGKQRGCVVCCIKPSTADSARGKNKKKKKNT